MELVIIVATRRCASKHPFRKAGVLRSIGTPPVPSPPCGSAPRMTSSLRNERHDQPPAGSRQRIQEDEYSFPYHWLPRERDGAWYVGRHLSWGYEYLGLLTTIQDRVLALPARQRILDVGCGDGRLIAALKNAEASAALVGVDTSARAIAFARAFTGDEEGVRFEACALAELPDDGFDIAILAEVLEHIPESDVEKLVYNVWQRLSPDGVLIASVPTANRPVNKKHERHYDFALIEETLSPHFEITTHEYVHRLGWRFEAMQRLLFNRLFAVTNARILRLMRSVYLRSGRRAHSADGAHLVVSAVRVAR